MSRHERNLPPLIGITPGLCAAPSNGAQTKQEHALLLQERYCTAIENNGGVPAILSVPASGSKIHRLLRRLDGLVVSGGNFDIHPSYYGEKPLEALGMIQPRRTRFELALIRFALERDLPILGICGGAQAINVALGGSLIRTSQPNCHMRESINKGRKKQRAAIPSGFNRAPYCIESSDART